MTRGRFIRTLYGAIAALGVLALFLPVELKLARMGDLPETLFYLLLFNLNLFALCTLVYLVVRGFMELYTGLRHRVIGFKFRAKILAFFVLLALIPGILIYVVASKLATSYMDVLFNTQYREPLVTSIKMATEVYENERSKALAAAEQALVPGGRLPENYKVYRLRTMPEDPTPAVRSAFEGKKHAETISTPEGDLIKAAVPYPSGGILIVNTTVPRALSAYIDDLKKASEGLGRMQSRRRPVRTNFLLSLGFIALTIMFTALFASLRLAKGITGPVSELARATNEVARGNLELKLHPRSADEMGLLIDSFNKMVSELKEGKDSLQKAYLESDRRRLVMEGILDNINSGVIALSQDLSVLTINPGACKILNIKPEDVVGRPYEAILKIVRSEELKLLIKSINVRTITYVEQELWVSLGTRNALLRVFITGLRDENGHNLGLLVVFDELTELVRAQRALAWQEVARRMAHEIKNPLTPIKLSTERMIKKFSEGHADFTQVFERSTKTIIKEVESLKNMVDEFSRFGKMPEIRKAPTDLAPVLEEVRNLYSTYKDLVILVDSPPHVEADLDPAQFKRVLINLIDNAGEAMGREGTVSVRIEPRMAKNRLYVEVADTGPGIPEEAKDKLFQPYFSTKRHGTGLGLAIVHKIISEHNGYIRVRDNSPHGCIFAIEMPLKEL